MDVGSYMKEGSFCMLTGESTVAGLAGILLNACLIFFM